MSFSVISLTPAIRVEEEIDPIIFDFLDEPVGDHIPIVDIAQEPVGVPEAIINPEEVFHDAPEPEDPPVDELVPIIPASEGFSERYLLRHTLMKIPRPYWPHDQDIHHARMSCSTNAPSSLKEAKLQSDWHS